MLSKTDIAGTINDRIGVGKTLVKNVLDELADLAAEEIANGEDFTVPGIVRISYSYRGALKKGEKYKKGQTYVGFGGVETTAEADSAARTASIRLAARPVAKVKSGVPTSRDKAGQSAFLRSRAGKNVISRKG